MKYSSLCGNSRRKQAVTCDLRANLIFATVKPVRPFVLAGLLRSKGIEV